ncbi:MAG: hypothetical protein JW944_10635 [Deltaproteobacteria bacterium]|nr:hypothetical protein [Deltaproteobacteria bacterium]
MIENKDEKGEELPLPDPKCLGNGRMESRGFEQLHESPLVSRDEVVPEVGFVKRAQMKNIRVKRRMAAELERLGLSSEAIGRILNLKVPKIERD